MIRIRDVVHAVLLSALASGAGAQSAYKVLDIHPGAEGSFPGGFTRSGSVTYFVATDPTHGYELWRTDGTAAGTMLVKDVLAGPDGAAPRSLTDVGGTLFFLVSRPSLGHQLWRSDGTAAGTVQVAQLAPAGSMAFPPNDFTAAGGVLFFSADVGGLGRELWKSDGTAAGTVLVKDIWPGANSALSIFPSSLTAFASGVVFAASTPGKGRELWKSDGTAAGTVEVADIAPGLDSSSPLSTRVVSGGRVYFDAATAARGRELWVSDGTSAGTALLADIAPGPSSSFPDGLTVSNGIVYFGAQEPSSGVELYRTDGTTPGTVRITDLNPGTPSSSPRGFRALGDHTIFAAHMGDADGLFRTDGTEGGTYLLRALPRVARLFITTVEARTYFDVREDETGDELWRTDGTAEGTRLVRDIHPGPHPSLPEGWAVGSLLLFRAEDAPGDRELWAIDGGAPEADAGPDQTVEEDVPVTLDGSASIDPQDDPLTYEWRDASGAVLATTAAFTSTFPRGIHEVTLAVSDGVNTGTDTVSVRVGPILDVVLVGEEYAGGTVTAVPGGTCQLRSGGSTTCTFAYEDRQTVELTATPAPGSELARWEGPCAATGPCTLVVKGSQNVTARFAAQRALFVEMISQENGLGSVRFDPPGDLCTLTTPNGSQFCERFYTPGETVVLTALPAPGSVFIGWSEPGCPGTGPCTVTTDIHQTVQARFLGPRALFVDVISQESGLGSVRFDPPGDLCTLTTPNGSQFCERWYTQGDTVVLTPLPAPGSVFIGWSEPRCPGTGPCTVTTDTHRTVQARFLGPRALFVDVISQESGLGSVRFDPPGDLCTLTTPNGSQFCERWYTQGDTVVLTPLPAPGSVFIGWSEPRCPGTGPCTVTTDTHRTVQARFLGPPAVAPSAVTRRSSKPDRAR
jgi:ELWxxDGT repeat protein